MSYDWSQGGNSVVETKAHRQLRVRARLWIAAATSRAESNAPCTHELMSGIPPNRSRSASLADGRTWSSSPRRGEPRYAPPRCCGTIARIAVFRPVAGVAIMMDQKPRSRPDDPSGNGTRNCRLRFQLCAHRAVERLKSRYRRRWPHTPCQVGMTFATTPLRN